MLTHQQVLQVEHIAATGDRRKIEARDLVGTGFAQLPDKGILAGVSGQRVVANTTKQNSFSSLPMRMLTSLGPFTLK